MVNNTFMIEKNSQHDLDVAPTLPHLFGRGDSGDFHWEDWAFVSGSQPQTHDSSPVMTFLRKSGSLLAVSSKSCATATRNSFCSRDRSRGTNFAATCCLPGSSVKICETIVHGILRSSSNSRTVNHRFSLIAARTLSTFSGVLLVEGLPERRSLSTDSRPSLKRLYHNFI